MVQQPKPKLRRKRPKRRVTDEGFLLFTGRVVRAYARRAQTGDAAELEILAEMARIVDTATVAAVRRGRAADPPVSWAALSAPLGMTRQGLLQKIGREDARDAAAAGGASALEPAATSSRT